MFCKHEFDKIEDALIQEHKDKPPVWFKRKACVLCHHIVLIRKLDKSPLK